MDKKESKATISVKINSSDLKEDKIFLNYRKETRIFNINSHEREAKVRMVLIDLKIDIPGQNPLKKIY